MSLKDRLDEEQVAVEAWRPDEGDELIGTITRVNERTTDKGTYPIYTVKLADGQQVAFHAFHSVARKLLEEQQPAPGDDIGVRYLGMVEGASNRYHGYRIATERREALGRSTNEEEAIGLTQTEQEAEINERDAAIDDDSIPF